MDNQELWQAVLAQIQFNISQANFATWFKNTSIIDRKDGQVVIGVPNNFSKEWLENKYNKLILKIIRDLEEGTKDIKYLTTNAGLKTKNVYFDAREESQLDFKELRADRDTNLNPRYQFDNFIVGPFNELPYAAATAIAKNPGAVYNPFFIYGGVGLGKTHLLQAIGNQILSETPESRIKYFSAEKFITEIIRSIKEHSIDKLKAAYQGIDILIIDDVQFFAGKEKTQEEFFHLFNSLYEKNKQIILSSDRPPKAIPAIEERLRSRFEGGMISDIGRPDFETRVAILKSKAQERGINLGDPIFEYIASHVQKNIRELEGALNKLIIYQKVNNRPLDLEITKNLLKNIINSPIKTTSIKKILESVCEFYEVQESDLFGKSRKMEIVKPRQVCMYFFRTELKQSFPSIGRKFSGKDHTTAIHSFNKIKKGVEEEESLAEEINLIKQRIYTG